MARTSSLHPCQQLSTATVLNYLRTAHLVAVCPESANPSTNRSDEDPPDEENTDGSNWSLAYRKAYEHAHKMRYQLLVCT